MSMIGRRVRAAVNPLSTTATRWWCHSAMRHRLTGYGQPVTQWRLIRHGVMPDGVMRDTDRAPSAGQMRARAAAIDELLTEDGRESGEVNRNGS
jgi:hypothetical protein